MIPVELKPEPENFDNNVRKRGHHWLEMNGYSLDAPFPKNDPNTQNAPELWQKKYNEQLPKQLYDAYEGICAYYAYRLYTGYEIDHFTPKSQNAGKAYEWDNYRLADPLANRKKGTRTILDPMTLNPNTFLINFVDGTISVNKNLDASEEYFELAKRTIEVLGLNDEQIKGMRIEFFQDYKHDPLLLKKRNPFVCYEAERQGLL